MKFGSASVVRAARFAAGWGPTSHLTSFAQSGTPDKGVWRTPWGRVDCVAGLACVVGGVDRGLVVSVSFKFELNKERESVRESVREAEEAEEPGVIVGRDSVTAALRSRDSVGAGRVSGTLAACYWQDYKR